MDKNFFQRTLTGTIFVIIVVGAIWLSAWSMFALFLLIAILGLNEFYGLAEKAGAQPQKRFGLAAGIVLICVAFLLKAYPTRFLEVIYIPLLFLPFFIELFRKKESPFANIGWTLLGMIYIVFPIFLIVSTFTPLNILYVILHRSSFAFVPDYVFDNYKYSELLTFIILIWVSDTMAYICGRLFGKHKLFERISPKKTWEGFIGGILFTMITAGMIANWILAKGCTYQTETKWIIVGAIISVCGVLGDLSESMFKRSINIKDSGTILPGHGGILDRFDAFLLATPFAMTAYWLCDAFHLDLVRLFSH